MITFGYEPNETQTYEIKNTRNPLITITVNQIDPLQHIRYIETGSIQWIWKIIKTASTLIYENTLFVQVTSTNVTEAHRQSQAPEPFEKL